MSTPPISARAALLEVLCAGPGFGLDLIERVRKRTRGALELHQGSVYPALRDLARDGLVTAIEVDRDVRQGGRPRRWYEITPAGEKTAAYHRAMVRQLFGF